MSPITYTDIDAYARGMRVELTPWDVQMIRHIDEVMIKVQSAASDKKSQTAKGAGKK